MKSFYLKIRSTNQSSLFLLIRQKTEIEYRSFRKLCVWGSPIRGRQNMTIRQLFQPAIRTHSIYLIRSLKRSSSKIVIAHPRQASPSGMDVLGSRFPRPRGRSGGQSRVRYGRRA